jgi:aspartate kinase
VQRSNIVVHKYGGSSLSSPEKIRAIAEQVIAAHRRGEAVAVVVSAMGSTTNELLDLARSVTTAPPERELDTLLSSGERISTAVMAMAIERAGVPAASFTGGQCGIRTTDRHGAARIVSIEPERVLAALEAGVIPVVAGFQGVDSQGETTTLGRGGSDTTAVALAAALGAPRCDIFSDIDGVYSADPRVVDTARRLEKLGYWEMQSLARHGARVLNPRAVEHARRHGVDIHARSTFGGARFTVIQDLESTDRDSVFGVAGVSGRRDLLRLRYRGSSGSCGQLLADLRGYELLSHRGGETSVDALVPTTDIACTDRFAAGLSPELRSEIDIAADVGSVAVVGLGVGDDLDAAAYARRALERESISTAGCFTEPEVLTCVVPRAQVDAGIRAVHRAFIDEPLAEVAA